MGERLTDKEAETVGGDSDTQVERCVGLWWWGGAGGDGGGGYGYYKIKDGR